MAEPVIGIIGGTGLGSAVREYMTDVSSEQVDTPFGSASDEIILGKFGNYRAAFINRHGPGHKYSPSRVPYAANIYALKKLGVRTLISIGAVGSLREQIQPGQLVLADQFIDKTYSRANTFFDGAAAVHCEFSHPTCDRLRAEFAKITTQQKFNTHNGGCYVCMEGPQFSTRAESLMHRSWGGDLIGMTALPEAKLAREAQICYVLLCLVSDYDCWKEHSGDGEGLLAEILANIKQATDNCLGLVNAVMNSQAELLSDDCICRKSLEKALWTNPKQQDEEKIRKLSVLFK